MVGVGGREVEEPLAHPLVELQRLPLDPVALVEAAEAGLRREVEHDGQVRAQVAVAQRATASTSATSSVRPAPW